MIDSHKHLVSRAFSKGFLRDMQAHAFDILDSNGLFQDEEVKAVKDQYLPWLYAEVKHELDKCTKVTDFVNRKVGLIRQNLFGEQLKC